MTTMQEPATAQWGLSVSDADFAKLKAGFEPQDQDDKWRVSANEQSSGNISVHLARSGTDKELYVLVINPRAGNSSNSINRGGVKVEAITWEQNKGGIHISEEQAKKEVVILARRILECSFEALPEYDVSELWNHPAAQLDTGETNGTNGVNGGH